MMFNIVIIRKMHMKTTRRQDVTPTYKAKRQKAGQSKSW